MQPIFKNLFPGFKTKFQKSTQLTRGRQELYEPVRKFSRIEECSLWNTGGRQRTPGVAFLNLSVVSEPPVEIKPAPKIFSYLKMPLRV